MPQLIRSHRRNVVDEARARAQQRFKIVQEQLLMLLIEEAEDLNLYLHQKWHVLEHSRFVLVLTCLFSLSSHIVEDARQMATQRVRSRASAAAENLRRNPSPRGRRTTREPETSSQRAMRLARESRARSPSPPRRGRGRPTSSSRGRGSSTGRGRGRGRGRR